MAQAGEPGSRIVHGEIHLADGGAHNLHAKVAASVTLTFAEILPSMEQPYAETFVYNAVRKTVDLGQLEFLKSGNRQPVPVTTRVVQIEPGPIPTLTASAPAVIKSSVASAVTIFPATISVPE